MNARTLPRHAESTILSDARTLLETIYADAIMDSNLVRSRKSVKVIKCPFKKPREKTMKYTNILSTIPFFKLQSDPTLQKQMQSIQLYFRFLKR